MKPKTPLSRISLEKVPSGICGLDEIMDGGFPKGRATLLVGGPGCGKTVLALQTLVNGARLYKEPGIFVAFEENSAQIIANAATFGWDIPTLERKNLFFLDAKTSPDLLQSGGFDLAGMLSILSHQVRAMGAKRIVFDSVDILLNLLKDPVEENREIYRINDWLLEHQLTALITSKDFGGNQGTGERYSLGSMQFMVDCALALNHVLLNGVSQRNLRVIKYRGSSFYENESPFVIGAAGLEVAGTRRLSSKPLKVSRERVSTGVARLDGMLGGGYYRGASVLITGAPGTAKSTLSGTFAEAACKRGEQTLFVSFDSAPEEIIRNLESVSIRLQSHEKRGVLKMVAARSGNGSAEEQFMRIKGLISENKIRNLIIDPVSALSKQGNELTAHSVIERLTDWVKTLGITMVCTSLLDSSAPEEEGSPLQISTIADTWIHLSYLVHAGERNRALTIIKSRGTAHSNQVREMILSNKGITLSEVYSAGGEVLMGTLRWEKEREVAVGQEQLRLQALRRKEELDLAEAELEVKLRVIERELAAKRAARDALNLSEGERHHRQERLLTDMRGLRGAENESK